MCFTHGSIDKLDKLVLMLGLTRHDFRQLANQR